MNNINGLSLITGVLVKKPELHSINLPRPGYLSNNFISIELSDGENLNIPIAAKDGIAEELMDYKKGDSISCICEPYDSIIMHDKRAIPVLGFLVLQIDHELQFTLELQKRLLELMNVEDNPEFVDQSA